MRSNPDQPSIAFGDIRDNEAAMRKVIAMLAYEANKARHNPSDFFTFVLREEHTRKVMKLAAHQKVLFDFVMYHDRCVIMLPVGHSKTFCMASLALWLLGHNPSMRGAIVSAAQEQSEKPLKMVREYIEQSAELKMVFPHLRKSPHDGHSWTQTALTVDRPMGIKDHSLIAIGEGSKTIIGSRLNFVLVDDILSQDNTLTPEARAKTYTWFDSSVMSRLDPVGSKVIVTNTAWHSRDLVHDLMNLPPDPRTGVTRGWPTLKMSATGEVRIFNSDFGCEGRPGADDLRDGCVYNPSEPDYFHCRLTAHDPDPDNEQTLFPERFGIDELEKIRLGHAPIEFARAYLNECRNDSDSFCKKEWVMQCLARGRGMHMAMSYHGPDPTFTGVDLAVSQREGADSSSLFTFSVLPDGSRLLLDVDTGRYDAPTIIRKIGEKHRDYNSFITVENNGAQEFLRGRAQTELHIPIKAYTTGRGKAHPEFGVQGLFYELFRGGWIIPCDENLEPRNRHVKQWIEECLSYAPSAHTGDSLMASFFAREQARLYGYGFGVSQNSGPNFGGLLSR